jgi:flagellar hook protein FlgE
MKSNFKIGLYTSVCILGMALGARANIDIHQDGSLSTGHPYHRFGVEVGDMIQTQSSMKVSLNSEGYLIDQRERYVLGRSPGVVAHRIKIDKDEIIPASSTTHIKMTVHLPFSAKAGTSYTQELSYYSALGKHVINFDWKKTDLLGWTVTPQCEEATVTFNGNLESLPVTFNEEGEATAFFNQEEDPFIIVKWKSEDILEKKIYFRESDIKITGNDFFHRAKEDGQLLGRFENFKFTLDGKIHACFSNQFEKPIADLLLIHSS